MNFFFWRHGYATVGGIFVPESLLTVEADRGTFRAELVGGLIGTSDSWDTFIYCIA